MASPFNSANRSVISIQPATQQAAPPSGTPRAALDDGAENKALTIQRPAQPDAAAPLEALSFAELPAELMALAGMLEVPDILSTRSVNKTINESIEAAVDDARLQELFADQHLQRAEWQPARFDRIQDNRKLIKKAVLRSREIRRVEDELAQETAVIKAGLSLKDPSVAVGYLKRAARILDKRGQFDQSLLAIELIDKLLAERGPNCEEWVIIQCQKVTRFVLLGRYEQARNRCDELIATAADNRLLTETSLSWKAIALLLIGGPDAVNEACTAVLRNPAARGLIWEMAQHSLAQLPAQHRRVLLPENPTPVAAQADIAALHFWKGEIQEGLDQVDGLAEQGRLLHFIVRGREPAERERIWNHPSWQSHLDAINLFPELADKPVDFGLGKLFNP